MKKPAPIVSASHLAAGGMAALSEIEFALIVSGHAFQRWIVQCMNAAGYGGLSSVEVLILHAANHRSREKTLAEVCVMYNIEDSYIANYAVKKLEKSGLIKSGRRGKEKTISITKQGIDACDRYNAIRERLVVESVVSSGLQAQKASDCAALLRVLSGQYDQAARAAITF
jgi:predicted MarR family transcription regulator